MAKISCVVWHLIQSFNQRNSSFSIFRWPNQKLHPSQICWKHTLNKIYIGPYTWQDNSLWYNRKAKNRSTSMKGPVRMAVCDEKTFPMSVSSAKTLTAQVRLAQVGDSHGEVATKVGFRIVQVPGNVTEVDSRAEWNVGVYQQTTQWLTRMRLEFATQVGRLREREIMLFIGKPKGISNMISNGGRLSNEWQWWLPRRIRGWSF